MKRSHLIIGLGVALLAAAGNIASAETRGNARNTIKLGAYYFDGWTGRTDKWHLPERLQNEFGYRQPVWGWVTSTRPMSGPTASRC